MTKLPSRLIPTWLRQLKTEHLSEVYGMLQTLLERAGTLPNTPEKEEYVRLVEFKFSTVEQVLLEAINHQNPARHS